MLVLCLLVFLQVLCFFASALENLFATFRLTSVGLKGVALAKSVVTLLTWFYFICCILFFLLLSGIALRLLIFFCLLLAIDALSPPGSVWFFLLADWRGESDAE